MRSHQHLISRRLGIGIAGTITAGGLALFALGAAGPAAAGTCSATGTVGVAGSANCFVPVTVTATVPETVSLTVGSSTIPFGTLTPGTTATATETWTAESNDPAGFNLFIQPISNALGLGGALSSNLPPAEQIPDSDLSVASTAGPFTGTFTNGAVGMKIFDVADNPGLAISSTDTWSLSGVPGYQFAGAYSQEFEYTIVGN